jgi:hypothetical protein
MADCRRKDFHVPSGENLDGNVSPDLVFSYEVNGDTFYGSAGGIAIEARQINRVTDAINRVSTIYVRYDPSDPASSCLLNQDNTEIPFEIDHAPN